MLKSQPLSSLLLASGIAFASSACSSGGTTDKVINLDSTTGTTGANGVGGTGAVVSTGSPVMGSTGDPAGSVSVGGAGNTGVTSTTGAGVTSSTSSAGVTSSTSGAGVTSSTGSSTGGTGGADVTSSTGGSTGVTGTTGGSGGTGGTGGEDPNKIVLFDGSDETFNGWVSVFGGGNPWQNNGDGTMTVNTGTFDIISTQTFQDVFVHLEYVTPRITSAGGGQERGNSGIYMKGSYEVQILDTFGLAPADDGCGAIYGVSAPLVSACNREEEWNTYEIEFRANRCENGQKTANANFVEVTLNDTVVQQDVTVDGTTQAGQAESCDPKGILLQDHSSILPVSFRNIWVIPRN